METNTLTYAQKAISVMVYNKKAFICSDDDDSHYFDEVIYNESYSWSEEYSI